MNPATTALLVSLPIVARLAPGEPFAPANAAMGGADIQLEEPSPLAATTCAVGPVEFGIDVSEWQGAIDWDAVAADGVRYAFVRVSDGLGYPDASFDDNWAGARAAGIPTGVYQFFRADEDPVAQADLLLDAMGTLSDGDLPPVIDVETSEGLSGPQIADAVGAWLSHVEAATGVTPIIYTNKYVWQDAVGSSAYADVPLWIAHYTDDCPNIPDQWDEWTFHQYCDCGSVAGIAGDVDVNDFNGDLEALMQLAGGATPPGPSCGTVAAGGELIDNGDPCLELHGDPQFWRDERAGYGGAMVWTFATDLRQPYNYAIWRLDFEEAGRYALDVYAPAPFAESEQASYAVTHADGTERTTVSQFGADGWLSVGEFSFAAGAGQFVRLDDNTGEAGRDPVRLAFDAIRLTRLDGPEPSTGDGAADPSGGTTSGESDGGTATGGGGQDSGPFVDGDAGPGIDSESDTDGSRPTSPQQGRAGCRAGGREPGVPLALVLGLGALACRRRRDGAC